MAIWGQMASWGHFEMLVMENNKNPETIIFPSNSSYFS